MSSSLDEEVAARHTSRIHLRDVKVLELDARRVDSPAAKHLRFDVPRVEGRYTARGEHAVADLPFALVVQGTESASPENGPWFEVAEIHVHFRAVYRTNEIPPSDLPHALGVTAYMHVWPYFRAEVQTLTSKIGLPALTLPVVRSGQVRERLTLLEPTEPFAPDTGEANEKLPSPPKKARTRKKSS